MRTFSEIFQLREKKDHLIKKLDLPEDQKEYLINFFNKHPGYESKIDWNNKNLDWESFQDVIEMSETSNKSKKIKIDKDLSKQFEGTTAKILHQDDNNIFACPTTHQDAIFMNSFDCYGIGAKWCIGMTDDPKHWNDYIHNEDQGFVLLYSKPYKKKIMFTVKKVTYTKEKVFVSAFNEADKQILPGLELDYNLRNSLMIRAFSEEIKNINVELLSLCDFRKIMDATMEIFNEIRKDRILKKKKITREFVEDAIEKIESPNKFCNELSRFTTGLYSEYGGGGFMSFGPMDLKIKVFNRYIPYMDSQFYNRDWVYEKEFTGIIRLCGFFELTREQEEVIVNKIMNLYLDSKNKIKEKKKDELEVLGNIYSLLVLGRDYDELLENYKEMVDKFIKNIFKERKFKKIHDRTK